MLEKWENIDWFLLNVKPCARFLVNVSASLPDNPLMKAVVLHFTEEEIETRKWC